MVSGKYKKSKEQRDKISASLKGKHVSAKTEFKKGQMSAAKGKNWIISDEARTRISGPNNHAWKGGITSINMRIRSSREYKLWRIAVLERDNHTCVWCGSKKNIQTDHIKPFALFPELRLAIDNGRALCKECHKTTDTYSGKLNKKKRR